MGLGACRPAKAALKRTQSKRFATCGVDGLRASVWTACASAPLSPGCCMNESLNHRPFELLRRRAGAHDHHVLALARVELQQRTLRDLGPLPIAIQRHLAITPRIAQPAFAAELG